MGRNKKIIEPINMSFDDLVKKTAKTKVVFGVKKETKTNTKTKRKKIEREKKKMENEDTPHQKFFDTSTEYGKFKVLIIEKPKGNSINRLFDAICYEPPDKDKKDPELLTLPELLVALSHNDDETIYESCTLSKLIDHLKGAGWISDDDEIAIRNWVNNKEAL